MKIGVYLLEFDIGKHYLGSTNDLERRTSQHQQGMVHTTLRLGKLIGVKAFQATESLEQARELERKYKSWKNYKKVIEAMNG